MKLKIKKITYYCCIIIFSICLISSLFLQATYYHFDSNNVKNNIKLISSDKYEGRLVGSNGNYEVSSLIEDYFKNYKLSPLNEAYKENFYAIAPFKDNGIPKLLINDSKGVIKAFSYGTDFKEDMINFRTSKVSFDNKDKVDIFENSFLIKKDTKNYIFYVPSNKNFKFRSSFNSDSKYDFSIAITTAVYNSILDSLREGCTLTVDLPYTLQRIEISNVVGTIKGTSSNLPPLVFSAHFDHLGVDALGNYYNGALDNASGTAFLLELSKTFSTFIKPNRDLIFVALNGEEFGLLGSKEFANKNINSIKNGKVINFDMIGAPNTDISLITGSSMKDKDDDSTSELLDSFKILCSKDKIKYNVKFEDSSDHASFTNLGIDSLTLCNSDLSKIHTPDDIVNFIDVKSIDNAYSVVQKEVYSYAYNKYILLFYNIKFSLLIFLFIIILVIYPTIKEKILLKYFKVK